MDRLMSLTKIALRQGNQVRSIFSARKQPERYQDISLILTTCIDESGGRGEAMVCAHEEATQEDA